MTVTPARAHLVGWLAILGVLGLFIALGLLKFLVFLLFMHLVIDLVVTSLGGRVRFVSKRVVLYGVCVLLAGALVVLAVVVAPRFLRELPEYTQQLNAAVDSKIGALLESWGVAMDLGDVKVHVVEWGRSHVGESLGLAKRAGVNVVLLIFAFAITVIIAHEWIAGDAPPTNAHQADPPTLFTLLADFFVEKVTEFYACFRQVMGGQVIISAVNTALTVGLLVLIGVPHKITLAVLVFVFGLLPIVGNLISNTLICISALLVAGPLQVAAALVFLVVVHKLEYLLNSKIIGSVVHLPMLVTLLALLVGESLFHVSGMILAVPAILFVRQQLNRVTVRASES